MKPFHSVGLRRSHLQTLVFKRLVGVADRDADQDGGEDGDAERAAELLGRVDHAGRLALVLVGHGTEAGRVVRGEHHAETDALEHEPRDDPDVLLMVDGQGESDPGGGQGEEPEDERLPAALSGRTTCRPAGRRR